MLNNTPSNVSRGFTNNPYINGILWSGNRLPTNTITYSFVNSDYRWFPRGVDVLEEALNEWESVANIEFVRVSDNNQSADFKFNLQDNSFFGDDTIPGRIGLGEFSPPGEPDEGAGFFNVEELTEDTRGLKPGTLGFKTVLHELGHGLGLGHPHDDSKGFSDTFPGILVNGDASNPGTNRLNQGVWTTMSYNNGLNIRGFESSPMAFDIAAVQHLYGENNDRASGNTTYTLSSLDSYRAIWDTGGNDTISAIGLGLGVNAQIDLRDAPLTGANAGGYISNAAGSDTGFTIANRVKIENAQGGLYNDILIGNRLGNVLQGEAGNDRLVGLQGNDNLFGGLGNDTLTGSDPSTINSGIQEYDELSGGGGRDLFVLGDRSKAYYQGSGFATIADLDRIAGEQIVVFGSAGDYSLEVFQGGTDIFYQKDRIGYVENITNLNSNDFTFV